MSEPTTVVEAPAAPEATAPATPTPEQPAATDGLDGPFDAARAMDKIKKANAEAEGLRRRIKELEPAAKQFNALEEASKSEAQRLQEAAQTAQQSAQEAQAETLRLRIAMKHGLTEDDFDLLGSGTEEQITTRAQRIADLRAAATPMEATPTPAPGQRPVEQLRPGATPAKAQTEDDVNYARLFGPDAR